MKDKLEDVGYIFVYGTLKVGGTFSKQFDNFRLKTTPASIKGTMFLAPGNWFPIGILGGNNIIRGELHKYDSFTEVIRSLDRIEGYYGENEHNLYNRKQTAVITDTGKTYVATVYEFNRDVSKLKVIRSGEWEIK